ncbi:Ig-like domain-containing protein [Stenotrophomonas sp. SAU14A_NAIMI4_8]|uniref:Ig-like domain-containing protein n=1 Tax=Stenotrophomonas sp. SAU14A_NAIMI4_8 TaxID=2072409 RepID=UPI000D54192B|nr:Ig-like domain-containing protein [Stenotrophomonas sp. SAU14A_NAIMI4_8]AWH33928.1 hypothetical protein C1930_14195 [Stenotrophomonas sp. SAU14A_NAIMI4_8]
MTTSKKEPGVSGFELSNAAMQATIGQNDNPSTEISGLATPHIDMAIDDVGAQQGSIGNGGSSDDRAPRLSGSGQPGSIVSIYDNGVKIGSARVDASGGWIFQVKQPLSLGEHELLVSGLGQSSDPFVLDITGSSVAPPNILSAFDNAGGHWGRVNDGGSTDDATPELSGVGQPGSMVDIYDNGVKIGSAAVTANGTWSWMVTPALSLGEHRFTTNGGGVSSNPFVLNISAPDAPTANPAPGTDPPPLEQEEQPGQTEVNLAAPHIDMAFDDVGALQGPVGNGGSTDDRTPLLSGTGQPGSIVSIFDNGVRIGSARVDASGAWTFPVRQPLGEGEHAFLVTGLGQSSDPFVLEITGTAAAPPSIESAFDNAGQQWGRIGSGDSTDDATPQLSGTGEPGSTVTIFDNGQPIGTVLVNLDGSWSWTVAQPLGAGEHQLVVNSGGADSNPFVLNVTGPGPIAPSIVSAFDDVGQQQGPVGSGARIDDATPRLGGSGQPGGTVDIYDNGQKIGSVPVDQNGTWSWTVTPALTVGMHQLVAISDAGSSGPFVLDITSQAPAPVKPDILFAFDDAGPQGGEVRSGGSTDDTTPRLNGTAQPGTLVSIYDNGQRIATVPVSPDGSWAWTVMPALGPGAHQFVVSGGGALSGPFVLEITPPAASKPSILSAFDDAGQQWGEVRSGGNSDDTTPRLNGTGKPGSVVDIFDNGEKIGSVQVGPYGTWAWTVAPALDAGSHQLMAKGGGVSSDPFVLEITPPVPVKPDIVSAYDDVGYQQGVVADGGSIDDTTPRLSGTGKPGSIVDIHDNGEKIGSVPVDGSGHWAWTVTPALEAGAHQLVASSGGVSSDPYVLDIRGVPVAEKPVIVGIEDRVGPDTGNIENGGGTDDTHPILRGTGVPNSAMEILLTDADGIGGLHLGYATVDGDGNWEYQVSEEWALGGLEHFMASGEGGTSDVYVIDIQLPNSDQPVAMPSQTDDGLAGLALEDLLQPGVELFAEAAGIDAVQDVELLLDTSPTAETCDGAYVAVQPTPMQPWEVQAS